MGDEKGESPLSKVGIDKKYNIIQKIGQGGFGEVHLVEDKEDHKQYVVKAIIGRTREEIEWAKREIEFLKGIRHQNIVLYKEDFEFYLGVIVIMEYCSGGDLAKLIKSRKTSKTFFPENVVIDWLKQICEALQYLHSKNILHRDLKPANIFITEGNVIKLGDFGVSRQLISQVDLATTMVGTPLYISPEMQRQEPYNHKSDVWSAGCSVYELMTFLPAVDPMMVYVTQQWVVRDMPKNYSTELCGVVKKMLTVEAASRPSIGEILEHPILKNHHNTDKEEPSSNLGSTATTATAAAAAAAAAATAAAAAPEVSDAQSKEDGLQKCNSEKASTMEDATTPVNSDEDVDLENGFVMLTMDTTVSDKTIACVYTTKDLSTTYVPGSVMPSLQQLRDLGYTFNYKGQLITTSGERFKYNVFDGDREANEKHYQEVARIVNDYAGDLLETELNMKKVIFPVDCIEGEPHTFIYATSDSPMNKDKLLILIGGAINILPGIWSRKAIINDSLDAGSQMPVVRQAVEEGYNVVILNQNKNDILVNGVPFEIRGSSNPLQHALHVWDYIITKNTKVPHIAFLTHNEGGRIVLQLAAKREAYFKKHVFAVAFCNSRHDELLSSSPRLITDFFNTHSRNWVASDKPLDEPLQKTGVFAKKDLRKVSAGDQRMEWTVPAAKDSVFKYLHQEYCKATNTYKFYV